VGLGISTFFGRRRRGLSPPSPARPTVGFAGDPGGAPARAQILQDLKTLGFAGMGPARDFGCGAHAAKATPGLLVEGADADAGGRKIDQQPPHISIP
jgi:hypothetical protein